jgi:hypothetical protein
MAKKSKKKGLKEEITESIGEAFRDQLKKNVFSNIRNFINSMINKIERSVYNIEQSIVNNIIFMTTAIFGILLFSIGASLFIDNFLRLPFGTGFMIIGLLAIIISTIFFTRANKKNRTNE